jgi:DNA-binding transcriptional LysR family regulator
MPVPDSSLIVRRLASYRFVVCGAPAYFAKHGVPRTPADLVHHNCLVFSNCNEWPFSTPRGEQRVKVSGNLRTNSAVALRLAALQGQGLIAATSFQLADEIKSGRLVPVLTEFLETPFSVLALYPHRPPAPRS